MGEAATGEAADAGTPAIEGWFTTGAEPALLASRCTTCGSVFFPRMEGSAATPPAPARASR